jgi:hypothetical protein
MHTSGRLAVCWHGITQCSALANQVILDLICSFDAINRYDKSDIATFNTVQDVQFVSTLSSSYNAPPLDARLLRHFVILACQQSNDSDILSICTGIASNKYGDISASASSINDSATTATSAVYSSELRAVVRSCVQASVSLLRAVQDKLKPVTNDRLHYQFR